VRYFIVEEVWSISKREAERKLLRSFPPVAGGGKEMATKCAEELASKFKHTGYENDATYPYWFGRNEEERESHRFVIKPVAASR
jgi:hypothetical protein